MKIRQGFVSNSSSSSFLIYGTTISSSKIVNDSVLKAMIESEEAKDLGIKNLEEAKKSFEDDTVDTLDCLLGMSVYRPDYYGGSYYIGRSWDEVQDDETGRQFKDRIEAKIKKFYPEAKFGTHEEAWHD